MGVKRLAALYAAVIMAAAALPARSAKAFGETYTITLRWPHKWVYVSADENPLHHGYFDVEYDEHGSESPRTAPSGKRPSADAGKC